MQHKVTDPAPSFLDAAPGSRDAPLAVRKRRADTGPMLVGAASEGRSNRSRRAMPSSQNELSKPPRMREKERGKVGLAILMWMLGVPGLLVLLYLIFA